MATNEKRLADEMEAYLQAMTEAGEFCGAVLVAQDGEVLLSGGYGLADREHDVPNTPQTKFRLGSITKQFTSMAILMLAEQEKLSLDDPLSRHLPYSPEHWKDITVHHLLNHTSGRGNLADIPGIQQTKARLPLPVREIVETFRETPLEFRTGTAFRYSNSGYFVLGDIIERVSGLSYEEFLQTHIFGPLAMADSGYDHYQTILKNRATGYRKQDGELVRAEYLDMSFPFSAGALYSTVEDLYRWGQALDADRLISGESYTRMTTITPLLTTYGYGLIMGRLHNRRTIGHAGGVNGFRANFIRFPDEHASVIVSSNSEESDFFGVTKALSAIMFGEDYELPEVKNAVKVDGPLLASYAGAYEIAPGVTLEVEKGDGHLRVTYGQAQSLFLPETDTLFRRDDDSITFHLSGDAVSHLTLSQAQTHSPQSKVEVEARKREK